MAERYPQSTTIRVPLQAYLASDHVTPATGKTIAITISKNGASYANPALGATNATEIGAGSYYVDLSVTDTGTLGPLFIKGTEATIDNIITMYDIVNANTLGAFALPNASANSPGGLAAIVNVTGTAQGGSSNTITLSSGASATDQFYRGQKIILTGGTGAGQSAVIVAYFGSSKIAYIGKSWGTNPDNTTTYELVHEGSTVVNVVRTATAQSGTTSSVVLDTGASATDGVYIGNTVWLAGGTGAGQARICSSYTGSSKTASVTPNWATAPDNTSIFVMLPFGIQAATDYATASALAADTTAIISEIDSQTAAVSTDVGSLTIGDGTLTLLQGLQICVSAMAGKTSGAGTTSIVFRDVADTLNRISATVNTTTGERSATTVNVT